MTREIVLTRGFVTLVDDADFDWLNQWHWRALGGYTRGNKPYAARSVPRQEQYGKQANLNMHRLIMNAPDGLFVDHINGDTMDNRRENLRLATGQQNMRNQRPHADSRSRFLGVTWHGKLRKWQVTINTGDRGLYLGVFADETTAALVYDTKARELFGEFANCNFPEPTS
jgi:hypothetical protein